MILKPILLILAAGMGSRYGGLKQVDPVGPGGEILLEYSVYDALRAGFGKIVFVIRKDIEEAFRQQISSRVEGRISIDYAFQELGRELPVGFSLPPERAKPWGTAHAILCAHELLDGPFTAINADDYYGPHSFATVAEYLGEVDPAAISSSDYCMVGYRLDKTLSEHGSVSRGMCQVDEHSFLRSVVEHTRIEAIPGGARSYQPDGNTCNFNGSELVSMNFWGLFPSIFPELRRQFEEFLVARGQEAKSELYIPTVLDGVIRAGRGRVKVLTSHDSWFGVTYPEDKAEVIKQIAAKIKGGVYPERLWS